MTWLLLLLPLASAGVTEDVQALQPQPTRTGHPRFIAPELHDSGAFEAVLDRLQNGGEPTPVRMALVELLPRVGGEWAPALALAFTTEQDPDVRRVMADTAARADHDGRELVRLAAEDADPAVRAAALRSAVATEAVAVIDAGLSDESALVRSEAAFAAGALALTDTADALVALCRDSEPSVRLQAFRALRTVAPARARDLAPRMAEDTDARVRRMAERL